jgi:hypothetical protein
MNNISTDTIKNQSFNFYGKGITLGVISGLLMALVTLTTVGNSTIADSFLKYLLFLPFLAFGLVQLKNTFIKGNYFKEGILFGLFTSFVAAIAFVIFNLITIAVGMRTAEKFTYEAKSFADVIGFQGINFFEIIGLGLILTFICLQFLKFTGTNEDRKDTVIE